MDRTLKVKKLTEEFLNKGYGETMEHFMIAAIIEEAVGSSEYRYIVGKAKKKLLSCGKMVENVKGVGYRVVRPDDYTNQSAKCLVAGAKKIKAGSTILENAPVKDMSAEGIQSYNAVNDKMRILQAAIAGAKVEINLLASKRKNPLMKMIEQPQGAEKRPFWDR